MGIKFTTTAKAQTNGIKVLVYGRSGSGKTRLIATAPKPLIISSENKLLSIRKHKIPVMEVHNLDDLEEALYKIKTDKKYKQFKTISLDSISDIAEVVLASKKLENKDPRRAYNETNEALDRVLRAFRDLDGWHVYFSAKEKKLVDDDNGIVTYVPSMPGTTLTTNLPYMIDEVFYLQVQGKGNARKRVLLTETDYRFDVKDSSGALLPEEPADLTKIFNKIERN